LARTNGAFRNIEVVQELSCLVHLTGFEPVPCCRIRERLDLNVVSAGVFEEEAVDGDAGDHAWFVEDLDVRKILHAFVQGVDVVDGD